MASPNLLDLLESSGAILRGHFVLTSGRHSDVYFEKFRVLEQPAVVSALVEKIAEEFRSQDIDFVVGPTTGGIILAFEVARQLGCQARYVETENGEKCFRRNAVLPAGCRVLVVDDVLTTGRSVFETLGVVRGKGADVVGVAVLIDRSSVGLNFDAPLFSSVKVEGETWPADELPEWLAKIPVVKPGTRATVSGS
ncbi:MAG: orotate phosphoribosyltransferase [Armatimonadetes bacterium]|nr:orotate phosphoribosyltransferase [Armatimonadota bacterium]